MELRRGRLLTLGLLAAAAVTTGGGAAAAAPGCASARPAAQDLRYAREYRRLIAAEGATAWPGWTNAAPLLQRGAACEYLIGHPAPPAAFHRIPGLTIDGRGVFAAPSGAATPGPFAAPWKVGRLWVAMVPTRQVFERVVAQQLGPGAVTWTDSLYLRSLVHEAFHAWLMTTTGGRVPFAGSAVDEKIASRLLGDAEERLAAEGDALAAAIRAPTLAGVRAAVARFLALRDSRRSAIGDAQGLAEFEQQIEWGEGLPRYADLRLILAAGAHPRAATPGIHYTPPTAYESAFLKQLSDPRHAADGLRGRWQSLGAAEAMVLDRLDAGWRTQALAPRSLEALLRRVGPGRRARAGPPTAGVAARRLR